MSSRESETRNRILSAAWRLLGEQGEKNARMSDIAREAELSRQAVYLHFKSRTELMIATVQFGDRLNGADSQVQSWRESHGAEKLDEWILFWGNYIPQILGVAKALMIAKEHDQAAAAAWDDRMNGVRDCCRETMRELKTKKILKNGWNTDEAADALWAMLSISGWEQLTTVCGWSNKQYIAHMQMLSRDAFLK